MWAHYANSYRGISLEFDFVAGDNHFNKPQQVKYQHSPPIITDNELCSGTDISEKVFGYKHSQWEYEQEWRIFKLANTSPIVPFLPQSLKKVYLGPVPLSSDIFNEVYSKLSNYNSVNNTTVKLIRLKRDTWSYNVIEDIIF